MNHNRPIPPMKHPVRKEGFSYEKTFVILKKIGMIAIGLLVIYGMCIMYRTQLIEIYELIIKLF